MREPFLAADAGEKLRRLLQDVQRCMDVSTPSQLAPNTPDAEAQSYSVFTLRIIRGS